MLGPRATAVTNLADLKQHEAKLLKVAKDILALFGARSAAAGSRARRGLIWTPNHEMYGFSEKTVRSMRGNRLNRITALEQDLKEIEDVGALDLWQRTRRNSFFISYGPSLGAFATTMRPYLTWFQGMAQVGSSADWLEIIQVIAASDRDVKSWYLSRGGTLEGVS